jgi:predicted regulator of Ras-like GTPase activity (Roadblock/LC7/MglB family)
MDARQALSDLTEISSQVDAAVVFDEGGKIAGATIDDATRAAELAAAAGRLLAAADELRAGEATLTQLEVATGEGSVFVVRDGKTCIAATTGGTRTVGLVFYDLMSAMRTFRMARGAEPKRARKTAGSTRAKKTATAPGGAKKKAATSSAKKKTSPRKPAPKKKPDAP